MSAPCPEIVFQPLVSDDFPMLLEWLQRAHVLEWWDEGENTLEKVARAYSADLEETERFLALVDGVASGYFQYYRAAPGVTGCDQFLAIEEQLSSGLGTSCLKAFVGLIRERERPERLVVDPQPENKRAIRCYEKCGFVHLPDLSTSEIHYMELKLR